MKFAGARTLLLKVVLFMDVLLKQFPGGLEPVTITLPARAAIFKVVLIM